MRQSFPFDECTRLESSFLDLYISAQYEPPVSIPGCVCHATLLSGTVTVTAEGQSFQLQERDALRFAADSAYRFENRFNSTARILLVYQYLK